MPNHEMSSSLRATSLSESRASTNSLTESQDGIQSDVLKHYKPAMKDHASSTLPVMSGQTKTLAYHRVLEDEPWVEVIEQPKSKGIRFRYKCEGRSAGSIPGEWSTNASKTYPTIKIHNSAVTAAVVVVSCVTKDQPYYPHPHSLVGTDCDNGVCTIKVRGRNTVSLANVGVQCSKRHDLKKSLSLREEYRVDPFGTGYKYELTKVDLSAVRLCFQVFLPDLQTKKFTKVVPPVVSEPIIDKKLANNLVICRLSKQAGFAKGGDEVFLLCEKIKKEDIKVRFYQETDDGDTMWEDYGEFSPNDVHRQCALVFTTPRYMDPDINSCTPVMMQLLRPSDMMTGEPKPFQYIPNDPDFNNEFILRKRKGLKAGKRSSNGALCSTGYSDMNNSGETNGRFHMDESANSSVPLTASLPLPLTLADLEDIDLDQRDQEPVTTIYMFPDQSVLQTSSGQLIVQSNSSNNAQYQPAQSHQQHTLNIASNMLKTIPGRINNNALTDTHHLIGRQ